MLSRAGGRNVAGGEGTEEGWLAGWPGKNMEVESPPAGAGGFSAGLGGGGDPGPGLFVLVFWASLERGRVERKIDGRGGVIRGGVCAKGGLPTDLGIG